MTRITCDQPSNKPIAVRGVNLATSATIIAEAPDFSVPDPNDAGSRVVVAGEVWFGSPLYLYNKNAAARTVTVSILTEGGATITLGVVQVPAGETAAFPMQGQSLLKRSSASADGDRLRIAASAGASIDFWATAYERRADDHIGVTA
jgi:hypothetical protein